MCALDHADRETFAAATQLDIVAWKGLPEEAADANEAVIKLRLAREQEQPFAVALLALIVAWFIILVTGRYPEGIYDFVVGVMRWSLRVEAYSILLITDEYPPFSLG